MTSKTAIDTAPRGINRLKMHVHSFHEETRFSCDHCGLKAIHKIYLKMHLDSFHEEIRFSCDHCALKAIHKSYLKIHVDSFHEEIRF